MRIRGGGTKDHLGEHRPTDAVLDTTAMCGVVDHVPADLTVTVAAGTRFGEVQRALGERGQWIPLDPPFAEAATLGGIVAARSEGFGGLRYGGVRDLLIGATTALADGTVARSGGRVVKNVAGYDLNKLLIGSLGTLGVIAEVTFKVLPLPAAGDLVVARCRDALGAFAIADALLRTSIRPSALVVEGTRAGWSAWVEAQGPAAQVRRATDETRQLAHQGSAHVEEGDAAALAALRELPATATEGALLRVALPLGAMRSYAESATAFETFTYLVADAGTGLVRIHLRGDDAAVLRAADTLLSAAAAVGGSARVERRDAALRDRLGAWAAARPAGDFLMRRIKDAFDPLGILEPGRSIVG